MQLTLNPLHPAHCNVGMGYLFTSDCLDRQVDHRINRLIGVAVNFRGGEGWVSACHHCRVVPSDEDAQSLAKVTHHLVLALSKVLTSVVMPKKTFIGVW